MPAPASVGSVLCIGWDVGGWQGKKDGLAAIGFDPFAGTLRPVGEATTCGLGSVIAGGRLTLDELAGRIGANAELDAADRIVVGVDAPLGFPVDFVRSVAAPLDEVPPLARGFPGSFLDHPLAYRETDREVFRLIRKRPLSPSLDALTNNATKARSACTQLRRSSEGTRLVPREADDSRCAVIEVYPALCSITHADRCAPSLSIGALPAGDARDALLCALAAVFYEADRLGTKASRFPRVLQPDPACETIAMEGWIYAPLWPS